MWEYNYDYLCHGLRGFKYIKREKGKNGKWVYTYPDSSTASTKSVSNTQKEALSKIGSSIGNTVSNALKSVQDKTIGSEDYQEYKKYKQDSEYRDKIFSDVLNEYYKVYDKKNPREKEQQMQALERKYDEISRKYGKEELEIIKKKIRAQGTPMDKKYKSNKQKIVDSIEGQLLRAGSVNMRKDPEGLKRITENIKQTIADVEQRYGKEAGEDIKKEYEKLYAEYIGYAAEEADRYYVKGKGPSERQKRNSAYEKIKGVNREVKNEKRVSSSQADYLYGWHARDKYLK